MATQVNIYDAKTRLSKLIDQVIDGEEVVIARAGRPVAVLSAYRRPTTPREFGGWQDRVWIAEDFDELPADLLAAFDGEQA